LTRGTLSEGMNI